MDLEHCGANPGSLLSPWLPKSPERERQGSLSVAIDPSLSDLLRDSLAAFVGGLLLVVVTSWRTVRRSNQHRIERCEIEIRHTQRHIALDPFFPPRNPDE